MGFNDYLAYAAKDTRSQQRERLKWAPFFALFVLLCLAAMGIKSLMVKDADPLGGRITVGKFLNGNRVQLIIICVTFVLFIVFLIKTWKGRQSSVQQFVCTVCCGIFIVLCGVFSLLAVVNISGELSDPRTVELSSYTLCTDSAGKFYVAFDDDGGVLLQISINKYIDLMSGTPSEQGAGLAYDEVSSNSTYHDVRYYRSKIKITYYDKSVIYESAFLI